MPATDSQPAGRTFVVTVWQELDPTLDLAERWRFRLEDPSTHRTRVFAHPQGLITALKEGALDSMAVEQTKSTSSVSDSRRAEQPISLSPLGSTTPLLRQ